ncbi:hypothetical protein Tsubulata_031987 [Turnera subulata]|uniref:tRNA-splicing endonuclease subunit Sen54 N-terminal domain-containing protein n=1 Tax=Turnera subulata TaxID=218843 RepID=A0A9Q0GC55_9ROSI|nr:hypothetical protein Tsubulata_031987 [Turnera subulata]
MERDWETYPGEVSDSEVDLRDSNDDELYYSSASLPRSNLSKARWNRATGMAHVVEQKGKMWITTGIIRAGINYCSLEETLYLVEIGALILMDDKDSCISLEDLYMKVAEEKDGCCWERFCAYKHLKSLGYIVGQHGVPWSVKDVTSTTEIEDVTAKMVANLQFDEMRPVFDVYLPNSKFRKSAPGDPAFVVCLSRSNPPSRLKLETLERQYGIPMKICHVDHGHASFFSFDKVDLPVLP